MAELMFRWVAWHLPKQLVTWCYVRVVSYASTTKFRTTVLDDINVIDALKAWQEQNSLEIDEPFPDITKC